MRVRPQRPGAPREEVTRTEMASGTVREFRTPVEGLPGQPQPVGEDAVVQLSGTAAGDDAIVWRQFVLSLPFVIVGTLTLAVGVALVWGIGVALVVAGGIVTAIGVLMGFTP